MVWGSDDGCEEVDRFWKATICAGRLPAKAQANRKIERARRDIMQEETSGRRGYVSATVGRVGDGAGGVPFVEEVPRNPYSFKNRNRRKIPSIRSKVLRQFPRNATPIVVRVPSLQRCPISTANAFEKKASSATVVRLVICSTLANSLFSPAQCRDDFDFVVERF
jgi:hypothetical protein